MSLSAGCGGRSGNVGAGGEAGSGGAVGVAGARPGGAAGAVGDGCVYAGKILTPGSTFPSTDGCNMCTCELSGAVACTTKACNVCATVANAYSAAVEAAKLCNPAFSVEQCTLNYPIGLACGCGSFLNPVNTAALAQLKDSAAIYAQNACGSGIVCEPCQQPSRAYCSPAGRCEDTYGPPRRGCKVAGVLYPDGATGIPDPMSCNSCSCSDGNLGCTDIACPRPCPNGSAFGQQCAQCGPTDACQVVESGCFPTCVDVCAQPGTACISGLCLSGFCG